MRTSLSSAVFTSELSALSWRSVGAGAALGTSLLVLDASGVLGGPGTIAMWLGLATLGMGAAFTVDDACTAITSAAPVREARRMAVRLLVPTTLLGLWLAYAVVATRDRDAGLSVAALAVTGTGVFLLSLGMGSLAKTFGLPEPGVVVGPIVLLAVPIGLVLPFLPGGVRLLLAVDVPRRELVVWVVLGVIQVAAIARAGADPWRSRRRLRSLRP